MRSKYQNPSLPQPCRSSVSRDGVGNKESTWTEPQSCDSTRERGGPEDRRTPKGQTTGAGLGAQERRGRHRMWCASCLASACAGCTCNLCTSAASAVTRRSARIAYCGLFAASLILSFLLRQFAVPLLKHIPCTCPPPSLLTPSKPLPSFSPDSSSLQGSGCCFFPLLLG